MPYSYNRIIDGKSVRIDSDDPLSLEQQDQYARDRMGAALQLKEPKYSIPNPQNPTLGYDMALGALSGATGGIAQYGMSKETVDRLRQSQAGQFGETLGGMATSALTEGFGPIAAGIRAWREARGAALSENTIREMEQMIAQHIRNAAISSVGKQGVEKELTKAVGEQNAATRAGQIHDIGVGGVRRELEKPTTPVRGAGGKYQKRGPVPPQPTKLDTPGTAKPGEQTAQAQQSSQQIGDVPPLDRIEVPSLSTLAGRAMKGVLPKSPVRGAVEGALTQPLDNRDGQSNTSRRAEQAAIGATTRWLLNSPGTLATLVAKLHGMGFLESLLYGGVAREATSAGVKGAATSLASRYTPDVINRPIGRLYSGSSD